MNQVLCSTGALIGRPNGRNYKLLASVAPQLECDGFEFMMYDSWYEKWKEVVSDIKSLHLNVPVMHCEKRIGQRIGRGEENDLGEALKCFEINCRAAYELGCKKMVLHLWDGMISDSCFEHNRDAYPLLSELAERYGILLTVENVVCNVKNPMSHLKELRDCYPDIKFTFDTKMAAFHQELELLYEPEWQWLFDEQHISHLHINDYKGGYMDWDNLRTLPIGLGRIDFQAFFAYIQRKNYHGDFTIEATAFRQDGTIDSSMLNLCFQRLRSFL